MTFRWNRLSLVINHISTPVESTGVVDFLVPTLRVGMQRPSFRYDALRRNGAYFIQNSLCVFVSLWL